MTHQSLWHLQDIWCPWVVFSRWKSCCNACGSKKWSGMTQFPIQSVTFGYTVEVGAACSLCKAHPTLLLLQGIPGPFWFLWCIRADLRCHHCNGKVQVTLVTSKTKVAPIKRSIPRLELCGAYILAQLLHHVKSVFDLPPSHVYIWTDSTIVLNWLDGSPRRFKTYVGNRTSCIVELIWPHVNGADNPADCAQEDSFPQSFLNINCGGMVLHGWHFHARLGLHWQALTKLKHPKKKRSPSTPMLLKRQQLSKWIVTLTIPCLRRVTAWIVRFVSKCKTCVSHLTCPLRISMQLTSTGLLSYKGITLRRRSRPWKANKFCFPLN